MKIVSRRCQLKSMVVIALLFPLTGCQTETRSAKPAGSNGSQVVTQPSVSDGLSAREIIDEMRRTYANAPHYEDQAALHLSYRLHGRYMEEPHQWNVCFRRPGFLKSSIYQVRLAADGQQIGCFIYDFGSGNLDNQWLLLKYSERLPIGQLLSDEIGRQYLNGQTELPLNTQVRFASEVFFPPTIALLTDTLSLPWFRALNARRLVDETLDNARCYQLQFPYQDLNYVVWIDADSNLIKQIQYPTELLDASLQDNPQVQNLQLVAKFHGATIDKPQATSQFDLSPPNDARLVKQFVAVPEPFPSGWIGKKIPNLGLRDIDSQLVRQSNWSGKVTMLAWLSNTAADQAFADALKQAADQFSHREYHIGQVAVPEMGGNRETSRDLEQLVARFQHPVYADFGFSGGRAIGLKSYSTLAVIDREGILQFVKPLNETQLTAEEIRDLLLRVRSGDDVAAEMRREYEQFMEDYHARLEQVAWQEHSIERDDAKLVRASLPQHFRVKKVWENDELNRPGNIVISPWSDEFLVIDGWQTLTQLNTTGKITKRKELDLGPGQSISIGRFASNSPEPQCALYSEMGRTVLVVDDNLEKQFEFKVPQASGKLICDALLADVDGDKPMELLVQFSGDDGLSLVELSNGISEPFLTESWRQLEWFQSRELEYLLARTDDGMVVKFSLADRIGKPIETSLASITNMVAPSRAGSQAGCFLGTDDRGSWTACGLDQDLMVSWQAPIGPQRFEWQIQSVTYGQVSDVASGLWLVAGSDGSITMIGDEGRLIDNWNFGQAIHGIGLLPQSDHYLLVISTEKQIEGWELYLDQGSYSSASLKSGGVSK